MAVLFSTVIEFFKDEPKLVDRGRNAFDSGHVVTCTLEYNKEECLLNGKIQASMKNKTYNTQIRIAGGKVTSAHCECPRGMLRCHHMATTFLHAVQNFSKTDAPCSWNKPKSTASTSATQTTETLWTPTNAGYSLDRKPNADDYKWLHDTMERINPDLGIVWLLSDEPSTDVPSGTIDEALRKFRSDGPNASKENFLASILLSPQDISEIEERTRGQSKNPQWALYRRGRLTCSNFGLVLRAVKRNRYPPSLFKTLLGEYDGSTAASIMWGKSHEETAVTMYALSSGVDVTDTGLWLMADGILGGTPDGLVGDAGLVEAKCPYKHKDNTIGQAVASDKDFFLEGVHGSYTLKKDHPYYHQIQGQIHVTNREWCDLVVWTTCETFVCRINKDLPWGANLQILKNFYKEHLLEKMLGIGE